MQGLAPFTCVTLNTTPQSLSFLIYKVRKLGFIIKTSSNFKMHSKKVMHDVYRSNRTVAIEILFLNIWQLENVQNPNKYMVPSSTTVRIQSHSLSCLFS